MQKWKEVGYFFANLDYRDHSEVGKIFLLDVKYSVDIFKDHAIF